MRSIPVRVWVLWNYNISEFKEMLEFLLAPPCCERANSKVLGPAVYKNIAEFNEIKNSSQYSGKGHTDHEAKSRRCRQFPMIKQLH